MKRSRTSPPGDGVGRDLQVLTVAVELHARDAALADRQRDAASARAALREAALELGITPDYLDRAEALVAQRAQAAAARRARRGRLGRQIAGLALGLAIAGGLGWAVASPPDPWSERFADRQRWSVTTSPRTLALLRWAKEGARDIALVTLDHVADREDDVDDDAWLVDLEARDLPPIAGHDVLALELRGTLPHARVILQAGPDERWLSPPITVQPLWTTHRLTLASFTHQLLRRGRWRDAPSRLFGDGPRGVTTFTLALGQHVNERDARGFIRVGELRAE